MKGSESRILVINTGSSSVKFQLFLQDTEMPLVLKGQIYNLGVAPLFCATMGTGVLEKVVLPPDCTHETAIHFILDWVQSQQKNGQISAVAHRIVHGGLQFTSSVHITDDVLTRLEKLIPLAPLHQAQNLAAVRICRALMPNAIQIGCFDTAFHMKHERLFTEYALPQKIREQGIRRYGFHGLSYEWLVHTLRLQEPKIAEGRIIAAHLGNGASLCAIDNGVSIDTTMGMTALDGLPMGTRCGNLDPGVVIYLIRVLGLSADEVEHLFYEESGLLGLSGWSHDVRLLEESTQPDARFALHYFCLRASQLMGMMAVALGGVDAIVFTGGIGSHSAWVRDTILSRVEIFKPFSTRIISANEERIMAMHSIALINQV